MLETTRHNYRLISILISTIAAGLPLWTSESRQIDFTDFTFLTIWLIIGVAASFVAQFVVNLKPRDMIGSFAIGYVTAVVLHFIGTILLTSYIQTRFELSLLVALVTGILAASLGSLIWKGIKSQKRKRR